MIIEQHVSNRAGIRVQLQPSPRISLMPQIRWERFDLRDETVYDGWVGRLKLEAFATPRLWARILVDRSTFDNQSGLESLVAYEREPGKAVYLGGSLTSERDDDSATASQPDWQLFTKMSWVFGS